MCDRHESASGSTFPVAAVPYWDRHETEPGYPAIVAVPPANAFRDFVLLSHGELRHYGVRFVRDKRQAVYVRSVDSGRSWSAHLAPGLSPGGVVQSPYSGDWITVTSVDKSAVDQGLWRSIDDQCETDGLYVHRSTSGIDGPYESTCISRAPHGMPRQPLVLRGRNRFAVACQIRDVAGVVRPVVLYSDDDGHMWQRVVLDAVGPHVAGPPHEGPRWENYACEPSIVELSDGRLWMLARTSMDRLYQYFSADGGATWSVPEESPFFGTNTMPTLWRLEDNRIVLVWNNTVPLPELEKNSDPQLNADEVAGRIEDVFTNRDALHMAITDDDGVSWCGFRELHLNERRNDSDFRTRYGNWDSLDKGVHQSQVLELADGRLAVSFGQHHDCRRIAIVDPDWLNLTTRTDDLQTGLESWCVHQYYHSVLGNLRARAGHCQYNRRVGATLIPDPEGARSEVLQIGWHPDSRLVYRVEGAVWNFPAGRSGTLRLQIRVDPDGGGGRIRLLDRWVNPVDPFVGNYALISLIVNEDGAINGVPLLQPGGWQSLHIRWDLSDENVAVVRASSRECHIPLRRIESMTSAISYLHLQSAPAADTAGAGPSERAGFCVSAVQAVVDGRPINVIPLPT